jgi:hypothetical protein
MFYLSRRLKLREVRLSDMSAETFLHGLSLIPLHEVKVSGALAGKQTAAYHLKDFVR